MSRLHLAAACALALTLGVTSLARADEPVNLALHYTLPPANHPSGVLPSTQGTFLSQAMLVGGGARANGTGHGSLLTQNAPGANGSWAAAAKDHLAADPATLDIYGVYLGVSRDDWEIIVREATGAVAAHPTAAVTLPPGFVMTSGGCRSNWNAAPGGAGNLLTASFPANPTTWECRAKDHGTASPASLTAYVVGIRAKKAGLSPPVMRISTARSGVAAHPAAVAPMLPGFLVTGGGALASPADPNGAGQLLTASVPETKPLEVPPGQSLGFAGLGSLAQHLKLPVGWHAASKDHAYASPGTVQAFAINLKFVDATTAIGVPTPVAAPPPPTATPATQGARQPPPGMRARQQTTPTGSNVTLLQVGGPTGPGPQALIARTHGTYVQLTWEPISGARDYAVYRTAGSGSGARITPPGFMASELWDAVEDPRDVYRFSVVVSYTDGRSGHAVVEPKRPFRTVNPASLTVERVGTDDVADVRLTWPETFGAVAYRIDGGRLPNTGTMLQGGNFAPPTKWTAAGAGQMTTVLPHAAGTGAETFSIVAMYPHSLADYSARTTAALPAIAGRYRITVNGFRCNTMTKDNPLDLDGKADEIYPVVFVHDIDRTRGIERGAYYVRTPIHGDSGKHSAWLQAGSGRPNGGIMSGDDVPRVAVAGVRAGTVPTMRAESQTLPMLVWSGELRNGADALLVKPSIWEHDSIGNTNLFDAWLGEQRQTSLPTLLSAVGALDGRTGVAATTVAGQAQSRYIAWRAELGLLNLFVGHEFDRPIGTSFTKDDFTVQQPVLVITREVIEAELARAPGQLSNGIVSVTLQDNEGKTAFYASYTLYLQVERMP